MGGDVTEQPNDVVHVRASFRLAGLMSALFGTAWSLYSGYNAEAADVRRIDEAIKRIDARIGNLDATDQRVWEALARQRKEIKDDLRYEQEHRVP